MRSGRHAGHTGRALLAGVALAAVLGGCGAPNIRALVPASGPERTLVEVDGDTFLSTLYWDAGSASETRIGSGLFGTYLFSVPDGAALGGHDVELERGGVRGTGATFTVTDPDFFPAPRLDRISLVHAEFDAATGEVNAFLYVQGANVDAEAEVLVDGAVAPTFAHRGLVNDLYGLDPYDLAYPVYHWLALLVAPGAQPAGSSIDVQIRNTDGTTSDTVAYTLPADAATMDSDGDDLPDDWETGGYDADGDGTIDVDLPALGADPYRPDVLVEVDVMASLANPPTTATWDAARDAFDHAPIINPYGNHGINLVLDTSGTVPFSSDVDFGGGGSTTDFYALKNTSFDNATQGRVYHYCVWGNMRPNNSSGVAELPGDDLIVAFDDFPSAYQTVRSQAATFMHELGHNLDLRHGGANNDTYNPVHNSVMSYSWQLRTGFSTSTRLDNPVYAPLYYQLTGAVETGGAVPSGIGDEPDYSDGMGRTLDESSLDEPTGLYDGNAVDWNGDGDTTDTGLTADANEDGDTTDTSLNDYASWANLDYTGPRSSSD